MSELPEGWAETTVGEVTDSRYGEGFAMKNLTSSGYPVFGANGQVGYFDRYTHEDSEVLLTCRGATCGTVNISTPKSFVTSNSFVVQPRVDSTLLKGFLAQGLRVLDKQQYITGTAQPQVTLASFNKCTFPLPPLNEQRRIVDKIEALTARSRRAKEALDEVPALLDKLRQSILAAAFRGDLTADWRAAHPDVEPASVLLERIRHTRRQRWEAAELAKMRTSGKPPKNDNWKAKYKEPAPVDTEGLPELPDGWAWASVEELCHITDGEHISPRKQQTGVPLLAARHMLATGVSFADAQYVTPEDAAKFWNRCRPHRGDVAICSRGTIGRVTLVDTDEPFCLMGSVILLQPWLKQLGPMLAAALRADVCREQVMDMSGGTAVQALYLRDIRGCAIPLPPSNERKALMQLVDSAFCRVDFLARSARSYDDSLAVLDSAILAKAFRGELVPRDPNDEPASALLERIRAERGAEGSAKKAKKKSASKKKAPKTA